MESFQQISHLDYLEQGFSIVPIIRKIKGNKFWQGCGETENLVYYGWEYEMVQPLWKTLWSFLKKIKAEYHVFLQPHS